MKRYLLTLTVALLGGGFVSATTGVADRPPEPTPQVTPSTIAGVATPLGSVRLSEVPPISTNHPLPPFLAGPSTRPRGGPAPIATGARPPEPQSASIPGSADVQPDRSVQFLGPARQILVTYIFTGTDADPVGVSTDGRTLTFTVPDLYNLTAQQPLTLSLQGLSDCAFVDSSRFYGCPLPDGTEPLAVSFRTDVPGLGVFGRSPGFFRQTTLAAGWNLVSDSAWLPLVGPIEALQADGAAYEEVLPTALEDGLGYWLYVDHPATLTIHSPYPAPRTVPVPAGQWVLVGNSTAVPVDVTGADAVYVYDPVTGYDQATELQPGQGAWAYAAAGGVVTLNPQSP